MKLTDVELLAEWYVILEEHQFVVAAHGIVFRNEEKIAICNWHLTGGDGSSVYDLGIEMQKRDVACAD